MTTRPRINHVALVVADLEASLSFWRDGLGLSVETVHDVPAEASQVAYMPAANARIELVRPVSSDSGVARFLAKRGPGMHHVCLEVANLDEVMARLRERAVRIIHDPPRVGGGGTRYTFIHPDSTGGVLVELYETAP